MQSCFLACLLLNVAACVSIPKTTDQLVASTETVERYCYDEPVQVVETRVEALLSKCYHPVASVMPIGNAYVPMTMDWSVIKEDIADNKTRYSVGNKLGYGFSAEMESNADDCQTKMTLYGVTEFWKRFFAKVDSAAQGGQPGC